MKRLTIGLLTSLVSVSGWSACAYNFNLTQAQVDSYNNTHTRKKQLMTSIDVAAQKGTSVIALMGNPTIDQTLTTSSMLLNNTPDKIVSGGNILAIEAETDTSQLQSLLSGSNNETQQLGFVISGSSAAGPEIGFNFGQSLVNNSPTGSPNGNILTIVGASTNYINGETSIKEMDPRRIAIQVPASGKVRFGLYINQISKQLGFIINGINYGYMNVTANNPITKIGILAESQAAPYSTTAFLGKSVSMTLITDKSQMQFSYPTGTTDICGNTI